MPPVFEVHRYAAAGRLGELRVPRADATVETPALLPVVNPHVQAIDPARLASDFGAEMLITNAYVLYGSDDLREPARERGLHDLLGFDGPIMTDSGSFQLAEYGEIDVDTPEILRFQHEIGSDVATPVDIPTPPDVTREAAASERETTQERIEQAAAMDLDDVLVTAPIQGSTYPDLRETAAREAAETDLDIVPIGGVVPLLRNYRFADVVDVVAAAKRGLPESAPVHLFGAGHPMMFALAVAMGCDLFDSAAYALYARDGRYLTVRGTEHLEDLEYLPCECPVCTEFSPHELRNRAESERARLLAEHNLHVSFGEMRRVKDALSRGTLLELVDTRARGHPAMLDGYRALLDHADLLEATDPVSTDAFFYLSAESAARPEVRRHHDRLDRLDPDGPILLTEGGGNAGDGETWPLIPPFGPVPPELRDAYPLSGELPERTDDAARAAAADGVAALVDATPNTAVTVAHRGWSAHVLDRLPASVERRDLTQEEQA